MPTAVMSVEGVLRRETGGTLIPAGVRLYNSLRTSGQVILLTNESDEGPLMNWLDVEGLTLPNGVQPNTLYSVDAFIETLVWLRGSRGYPIDLVVDSWPQYVEAALTVGFNTVLFTEAQYQHPDWRADRESGSVLPWDALVEFINEDKKAKAEDKRLKDEE